MNANQQETQMEFFLVQKCWFDGPNVKPPCDYLALFANRHAAEELALHSAHAHASHQQAVVRTILLPTGYAFSSAGDLFWVRRVVVDVVNHGIYGMNSFAHAIFTGHVVGGTGNVNSRRGSEAVQGVVFVGPDSHARALQAMTGGGVRGNSRIACISMAPLENVMDGWSAALASSGQVNQATPQQPLREDKPKRSARQACNVIVSNEAWAESSDVRPWKRQCSLQQRGPCYQYTEQYQQPVDSFMQTS